MSRRALAALLALGLAGCVAPQPESELPPDSWPTVKPVTPKPEPIVERPNPTETLLAEFERFRRLSAADLAREQEAARQAFAETRSDVSRVQLAMALSVTGSTSADDARALELLDPLVKNLTSPLHGIAFLLAAHIQEQRRLVTQLQTTQQTNQGLQQNVQALQQNVQGLQQKLDALRTLERSLSERESTQRKR